MADRIIDTVARVVVADISDDKGKAVADSIDDHLAAALQGRTTFSSPDA